MQACSGAWLSRAAWFGLDGFTSVPHLVLEDLKWILKLCCRDWREIELQVSAV